MGTIGPIRFSAALALVVLCLCPLYSADAWEEHIDLVYDQLKWDHEWYESRGYTFVHYIVGKLDDGEVGTWTFDLSRRTDYVVSGVCNGDCWDLDLRIETATGVLVDSDHLPNYYPEVFVTPRRDRNYSVEVDMFSCSAEPCYYGIALFERRLLRALVATEAEAKAVADAATLGDVTPTDIDESFFEERRRR